MCPFCITKRATVSPRFDVDRECEMIDGSESKKDPAAVIDSGHVKIGTRVEVTSKTPLSLFLQTI